MNRKPLCSGFGPLRVFEATPEVSITKDRLERPDEVLDFHVFQVSGVGRVLLELDNLRVLLEFF